MFLTFRSYGATSEEGGAHYKHLAPTELFKQIPILMPETNHFVNDGYGWTCKRCSEQETAHISPREPSLLPRFFREGEAEEREPHLSTRALARWKDETRRTLRCTRCGVEEDVP